MLRELLARAITSGFGFCPRCWQNISSNTVACPHCGEPHVQERLKAVALAAVPAVGVMFVWHSDLIAILVFWGTYMGLAELFINDER